MKKRKFRSRYALLIPMAACAAFLLGGVKLLGIPADALWSGLLMILIMVGGLLVAAALTVAVIQLLRRGRGD